MTPTPEAGDYVLTVRDPWASAIIHLGKSVENRSWPTRHRGRIWIHVAAEWNEYDLEELPNNVELNEEFEMSIERHRGYIIGSVEVVDCIEVKQIRKSSALKHHRAWASGPWCWILADPILLPNPVKMKGALGLWKVP